MQKKLLNLVSYLVIFFIPISIYAFPPAQPWHIWVHNFKQEAIAEGIRPSLLDAAFKNMTPNQRLLRLDRNQPEKRLTFLQYRNSRCDQYRITIGRREFRRYRAMVDKIGKEYGVSPYIIVSLWGMESSYGRYMGNFSTIRSLATLAHDKRRASFFRKELLFALHMLNDKHVRPQDLKGEWAGATGQPQFLPSSWHHYAVDYNNDGKKDIWRSHEDIFASIANYLHKNGWQDKQPWGFEVTVPSNFDRHLLGLKQQKTLQEWLMLGVRAKTHKNILHQNLSASLVKLYGGTYVLAFNNFKVLMRWNRSTFYAATVGYLADQIRTHVY